MKVVLRIIKNQNGMHRVQRRKFGRWKTLGYWKSPSFYKYHNFPILDRAVDFIDEYVEGLARGCRAKRWSVRDVKVFNIK
jgi:hypothetical protein